MEAFVGGRDRHNRSRVGIGVGNNLIDSPSKAAQAGIVASLLAAALICPWFNIGADDVHAIAERCLVGGDRGEILRPGAAVGGLEAFI